MDETGQGWSDGEADDGIRVLHVDDDDGFLEVAADLLERESDRLTVVTERSGPAALSRVENESIDCVVADYRMPEMDGLELLAAVRERDPDLPFILFTGSGNEAVAGEAISAGVTDYFRKGGTDQYAVLANRVINAVEQRRMETAVAETEARYRALIEHSRDVTVVVDEDGVFQYVSPGARYAAGYDPEELVGENSFDYIHPDDVDTVRRQLEAGEAVEGDNAGRVEYRFLDADGEYRWFESIGSNEYDAAMGGYIVSSREITDRKERERELEGYKTMMQTVPDGVILLDEDGRMTRVNEAWAEMVGFDQDQLEGQPFPMLVEEGVVGEEIIERYLELVKRLLSAEDDAEKGTFTTEVVPPGDAREHVYEAHIALLPFDEEFAGTTGVVRDVTEKVRRRRELERQNERLERFASVVSHDLRNPLDIAMSQGEIIRDQHGVEMADDLVETLEGMADLIDDVLALARQGRVVDDPDRVDLEDVVDDAADTVGIPPTDADLRVVDDLPTVEGDPERLRALFENLLSNAVAHGGDDVEIRVGAVGANPGDDGSAPATRGFYVEDDGAGIPDEERDRVFEAGFTSAEDGTGFGLNIVEEIAEAHDWRIDVADGTGGGARFEVIGVRPVDATDPEGSAPGRNTD